MVTLSVLQFIFNSASFVIRLALHLFTPPLGVLSKMSAYLKVLGLHVYVVTTKKSYLGNENHIEVNAQALIALKQSLSKEYLCMASHCDSAFAV